MLDQEQERKLFRVNKRYNRIKAHVIKNFKNKKKKYKNYLKLLVAKKRNKVVKTYINLLFKKRLMLASRLQKDMAKKLFCHEILLSFLNIKKVGLLCLKRRNINQFLNILIKLKEALIVCL